MSGVGDRIIEDNKRFISPNRMSDYLIRFWGAVGWVENDLTRAVIRSVEFINGAATGLDVHGFAVGTTSHRP